MLVSAEWQTLKANCNNRSISRKEENVPWLKEKQGERKGKFYVGFVFKKERLCCILRISQKSEQDSRNREQWKHGHRRKGKFWCKNGKEHMQNFKITNPKGKVGHFDDTKFKGFC